MMPIAKVRLEEICIQYMNHQPRMRPVSRISLGLPGVGLANWSLNRLEPSLDLLDVKTSFAAVRELQSVFRLTE